MTLPCGSRRSRVAGTLAGALAATLLLPALPGSAATPAAAPDTVPLTRLGAVKPRPAPQEGQQPALRSDGSVVLQLELDVAPTSRSFAGTRPQGLRQAAEAADRQGEAVGRAQRSLISRLSAPATKADVLYTTSVLTSAVVVRTTPAKVAAIAALPGVASATPIAAKFRQNSSAVPLTGSPKSWEVFGTGKGMNIAIVDTGIDYTHADFGGAGTEAAFKAADATDTVITPDGADPATPTVVIDQFPTKKVVGGYDLVGDAYNGGFTDDGLDVTSEGFTPNPDPNPLDCADAEGGGHGSHVAGTAAGQGVNADGSTYTGPYSTKTPFTTLKIGPGTAPEASLSAYRVFGCTGATFVVSQALDLIAGTRTDSDAGNDVNVMNLSLGADFTRGDDPDAQNIDKLALLGVTPVIAAGNPGDLYASAGSPGTAPRALTVAASDDGFAIVDGLIVTAPDSVKGNYAGLLSARYTFDATHPGVTDVATARPSVPDSCTPYTDADKALVAGKVALIDADGFACGSVTKTKNAREAGAVGAVIISDDDSLAVGITGDADIPSILIQATTGEKLLAADGVRVSINQDSIEAGSFTNPDVIDTPASFTARGGTLSAGQLKPDLTAPGVTITSAKSGTGSGRLTISGTSMASPHAAGIAALVQAAHPTYTVEQVKAAMMNTATQDLLVDPTDPEAGTYAPSRVGTGRVKADLTTATQVLAYASGGSGTVSVGLGPIDVTEDTQTITREVTVQNLGTAAQTYAVSTKDDVEVPGAVWTASPANVTVAAGSSSKVTLSLALTRDELRRVQDPTFDAQTPAVGLFEHFITESLGKLLLTPSGGGTQLRVAYGVAPRPASVTKAAGPVVFPSTGGSTQVTLTGKGVSNGSVSDPSSINSVVSGYQLQVDSPQLPACGAVPSGGFQPAGCVLYPSQRAGDLEYVGAASTLPLDGLDDGLAVFGLATYGNWTTPSWNYPGSFVGDVRFRIFLDTNGDGKDDRLVDVERLFDDTDLLSANLYDITGLPANFDDDALKAAENDDPSALLDQQLLNGTDGSFDTNILQSNVMAVPVSIAALGLPADTSKISYRVQTESLDTLPIVLDKTEPQSFDLAHPSLSVAAPAATAATTLFRDKDGTKLPVARDTAGTGSLLGLLLLHHHAADGKRAEVVPVTTGTSTTGTGVCGTTPTVSFANSTIMATGSADVTVKATPNTTVDLLAYSQPSTTFKIVRSAEVGASGTATFKLVPPTNTRVYAQTRGCTTDPTKNSSVLNVRTTLSLFAKRNGSRDYTFSGDSLPARKGGLIISLYRVTASGSQVLTAQTRASATNGEWTIRRTFTGSGRFGFVVRTGQDLQNAPGTSNVRGTLIY